MKYIIRYLWKRLDCCLRGPAVFEAYSSYIVMHACIEIYEYQTVTKCHTINKFRTK